MNSSLVRRNGRQQSCERCRKLKIRCDHTVPQCLRCSARKLVCVYDSAPMTKRFRPARFHVGSGSGRVRATTKVTDADADVEADAETEIIVPAPIPADHGSDRAPSVSPLSISPTQPIEITVSSPKSGMFLGSISYRALMEERQNSQDQMSIDSGGPTTCLSAMTTHTIDTKRLDLGLKVVSFLRGHAQLLRNLMNHIYRVIRMAVMSQTLMMPTVDSLWNIIDDNTVPDDDAKLRTTVRIFQNSYQPIPITKTMTASEFCQLISGENLRWETIGNVLVMASLCLVHIHERDLSLLDPERRSKQDLMDPFYDITDCLILLTNASPVVNELSVCLKYNQLLLIFHRFGDSSQYLYSVFMELTSSIYATGIHQDTSAAGKYPTFIHQWRRKCFIAVYSMDKTLATILGRPPVMHRHYCILEPPLDIDDNLIGPDLDNELRKLDQHGWNSDDRCRPTSFMRLRYLLATVREEILELHLGVRSGNSADRAQLVLQKLQFMWENCPNHMKYSSEMWNDTSLSTHDIWFLLCFYIEYLYSTFLIFRITAQDHTQPRSKDMLLSVAGDVLSTVLVFNEQRERLREVRSDFSGIFLPYGLPCVEVLTKELLQRSNSPNRVGVESTTASPTTGSILPRVKTIRHLTLYVSCLSWVPRLGSTNSDFCKKVQERLSPILDQIIDSPHLIPSNLNDTNLGSRSGEDGTIAVIQGFHAAGQESPDPSSFSWTNGTIFDWDTGTYWDSNGLDLFSGPVL